MFSLLSILIHIINSIFSGVYTSQFLKCKQNKKITIFLWTLIYFMIQVVIFEVIQSRYPFNDVVSVVINVLLFLSMQWIFFRKGVSGQLFVCFSFVADTLFLHIFFVLVTNRFPKSEHTKTH